MINFRYIRWKNLLSTGNYFTEIKLNSAQNTLVAGENGSGKSTMLDALCFVLFGKAFRNINKPTLLNSINQKDCVVEVEFETNNKVYKVTRGIKPNLFEIYQNGILINQDAATRDYQEVLEKNILKLNYKSFTQIVILGSASFVPFMQLTAADRRAVIEDLLDIQIFSTMNNIVKDRLLNNKDLMTNKKYSIDLAEQKYEMQKKHLDEMKQDNEQKIKDYETEIESNIEQVKKLIQQCQELAESVQKKQEKIVIKAELEEKIKKFSKLETQIESNLSKHKKDISFYQSNDICPTCRQDIAETIKQKEIGTLEKSVHECENGLTDLEKRILIEQKRLNEIAEIQKEIQQMQVTIATQNTSVIEINKYNDKLRLQIETLKNSKTISEKEKDTLDEISKEIDILKKELQELITEKSYYEMANQLLKDTGIKTKIIRQYLPIINKLVNKYLAALDFFVNFNLDDSFKETIKSRHRDEFSYNNFSEGEKAKINLALLFTWRAVAKLKNSASTNLLILDEIVDSALDYNGIDNFLNLIHNMNDNTSVFVISPKGDTYTDKFANVIRFQKEKNFSKIVR